MSRLLFTLTSFVSLLLCMATVVLWVRSYWVGDLLKWESTWHLSGAGSSRGRVYFVVFTMGDPRRPDSDAEFGHTVERPAPEYTEPEDTPAFKFLGIICQSRQHENGWLGIVRERSVVMPDWLIVGASAILPARWWWLARWRWRRERRQKRGLCARCGYDLRMTVDRCPECGMPVPAKVASSSATAKAAGEIPS